jgi:hypothetical protein
MAKRLPQNRQKTGSQKLRSGRDPSIGKATQFRPGRSGNPSGRPRKLLTEAYEAILGRKYPGDRQKRTYAQVIAEGQVLAAIYGKTDAAREIADRVEGKVPLPLMTQKDSPLEIADVTSATDKLFAKLARGAAD